MKKKNIIKRILSGSLAVLLCVTLNIEPVSIIAGELAKTEFVKDCGVLYDNLLAIASGNVDFASAAGAITEGGNIQVSVDCDCDCDALEAIHELMGGANTSTNGITLGDIKKAIENNKPIDYSQVLGNIEDNTTSIASNVGAINGKMNTIIRDIGFVNWHLENIEDKLDGIYDKLEDIEGQLGLIYDEIDGMTHDYRVAHLYSLNNSEPDALWRPYSNEVPYVKDFAYVTGGFANIYTGYWDSFVTPVDKSNPALFLEGQEVSEGAKRAYEILGYDSVLRREGFIILGEMAYCDRHGERVYFEFRDASGTYSIDCAGRSNNGQLVCPTCLNQLNGDMSNLTGVTTNCNWETIIEYRQDIIPYQNITWFDAVTVLYKALGQEQVSYKSFLYHNNNITPATSPAYQNLSNIDGFDGWDYTYDENGNPKDINGDGIITEADKTKHKKTYQGYDYKIFMSRSNIYEGTVKRTAGGNTPNKSDDVYEDIEDVATNAVAQAFDVYWTKALNDGFVKDSNKDVSITGQDFFKLCQRMMEAYGEPVLNQDEIDALLQVYGADYPIQLGVEVADAWAYLKVRGCLDVDISYTGYVSRDQLLDVAMRIKDEDSRTDYKNINIVLDLADVMISDGYYPVADLNIAKGDFASSITYDYSSSDTYDIFIPYTEGTAFRAIKDDGSSVPLTNLFVYYNDGDNRYYQSRVGETIRGDVNGNGLAIVDGAYYEGSVEMDGHNYYHIKIPIGITTNNLRVSAWGANSDGAIYTNIPLRYIDIPATHTCGGIMQSASTISIGNGLEALVPTDSMTTFNSYNSRAVIRCTDADRAGRDHVPSVAYRSADATIFESLCYYWNVLTTPMIVEAEEPEQSNGSALTTVRIGFSRLDETSESGNPYMEFVYEDLAGSPITMSSANTVLKRSAYTDSATAFLYRLVTAFECDFSIAQLLREVDNPNLYWDMKDYCTSMLTFNYRTSSAGGAAVPEVPYQDSGNKKASSGVILNLSNYDSSLTNTTKLVYTERQWLYKMLFAYSGLSYIDDELLRTNLSTYRNNFTNAETNVFTNAYNWSAVDSQLKMLPSEIDSYYQSHPGASSYIKNSSKLWSYVLDVDLPSTVNEDWSNIMASQEAVSFLESVEGTWDTIWSDWYKIVEFVDTCNITNVTQASNGDIIITTSTPENVIPALGEVLRDNPGYTDEYMGQSVNTLLDRTVSNSAIMSREENILISWNDLIDAGFVIDTFDGKNPEKDVMGTYHIQTVKGAVKVNPSAHTILIGNTYYNLDDNGTGPELVYIHAPEDETQEDVFYLDYRCIMGLSAQNIRYDGQQTTAIQTSNSIGVGNSVVYTIEQGNVDSKLFSTVKVNSYNYPDVPKLTQGCNVGDTGVYTTDIIKQTMYDNCAIVDNTSVNSITTTYWDTLENRPSRRIAMSSFNPISNWLVSVRQDNSGIAKAYLYVWYPKEPFVNGYVDLQPNASGSYFKDETTIALPANMSFDILKADALSAYNDTLSYNGQNFKNIWDSIYGSDVDNLPWYTYMTMYASAKLYDESNGGYYLSPGYVCRRFDLSDNSAVLCGNSWTGMADMNGNSPYAMYWLEGIGYVYNCPDVNDFTYEKYLNGEILLPVAYDSGGWASASQSLVNFNVDYYGYANLANSSDTVRLSYGQVLSAQGFVNPNKSVVEVDVNDNTIKLNAANLDGYNPPSNDRLAKDGSYPYILSGAEAAFVYAPVGMYTLFGGLIKESASVKDLTGYVTSVNYIFNGNRRLTYYLTSEGKYYFFRGVGNYPALEIPDSEANLFHRVFHSNYDVLVNYGADVKTSYGGKVAKVDIYDTYPNPLRNLFDEWGLTSLIDAIDSGASFIITFVFEVVPTIALIIMTVLIGLSFLADAQFFQYICDTIIDPVKLITLGRRDIHTWNWRRVLIPCMLLYISLALVLNGNLFRIVSYIAEWYGIISRWVSNTF